MTALPRTLFVLMLSLVLPLCARANEITGLYLTWSDDPTTTMTVNWVDLYTDGPTDVHYRALGTSAWREATAEQKAIEPSTLQRRWVHLSDLSPDTSYEFVIGPVPEGTEAVSLRRFRTMPADLSARPVRFVTGGDMMHSREKVDAMNKVAASLDPDFALLGGDLAYENGTSARRIIEWLESWTQNAVGKEGRLIPMVPVIGNHEVRGHYNGKIPEDAPYFYGLFTLPDDRSYHAVDFGGYLSLPALDTGNTQPVSGPQAEWLGHALADRTDQQFLFPVYHFPAYGTSKAPENGTPIDNPRALELQRTWVPLFEQFGITAAFENDHHTFKRSKRIRNRQVDEANGLLYVGDGAWGVGVRDVPKVLGPDGAWWLEKAESRNHLWCIDLNANSTAVLRALDAEGAVFDEVTLDTPRTTPAE